MTAARSCSKSGDRELTPMTTGWWSLHPKDRRIGSARLAGRVRLVGKAGSDWRSPVRRAENRPVRRRNPTDDGLTKVGWRLCERRLTSKPTSPTSRSSCSLVVAAGRAGTLRHVEQLLNATVLERPLHPNLAGQRGAIGNPRPPPPAPCCSPPSRTGGSASGAWPACPVARDEDPRADTRPGQCQTIA